MIIINPSSRIELDNNILTHKTTINNYNGKIRIDEIKESFVESNLVFSKKTSFGDLIGNKLKIKDVFDISLDTSSDVLSYGAISKWPHYELNESFVFGKLIDDDHIYKSLDQLQPDRIQNNVITDNTNIIETPNMFENEYQLPYLTTLGTILSFFSCLSINVPFVMEVIFDSDKGFNIFNVSTYERYKNILKEKFKLLIPTLSELYKLFKSECEKENMHIKIFINVYPFGTFVKITNGSFSDVIKLNLTDHFRILQVNESYKDYPKSLLFDSLIKLKVPTVIDTFGSTILEGDYND